MIRKAVAVWRGMAGRAPGIFPLIRASWERRRIPSGRDFESERGTNPEELVAAAHAGCFTTALAFRLQTAGVTATELNTEAAVTLEPEGQGFRISRSALTLRA